MNNKTIFHTAQFIIVLLMIWGATYIFVVQTDELTPRLSQMEGEGIIVKKINRGGEKSGLWVKVENGTEIGIPPTDLWDRIQVGDHIRKQKNSTIYYINSVEHDMRLSMKTSSLRIWIFVASVFSIGVTVKWLLSGRGPLLFHS